MHTMENDEWLRLEPNYFVRIAVAVSFMTSVCIEGD